MIRRFLTRVALLVLACAPAMAFAATGTTEDCTPPPATIKAQCEANIATLNATEQAGHTGRSYTCVYSETWDYYHRYITGIGYRATRNDGAWGQAYSAACPNVQPPPKCTAGEFVAGAWPTDGSSKACRGDCETEATIQIGGDNPTFGTVTTGNVCPATAPPPDEGPGDPKPGYTPDDPNDPGKGGTYCTSNPVVCTHGPAPNTGGSGGTPGGGDGGSTGGGDDGGSTGGGSTGGGDDGGSTGGGSTGGGSTGGGDGTGTGGGNTGGGTGTGDSGGGDGNGDGTGDKDCTAGDACHAGAPTGATGQLYKPDGSTVAGVFGDFATKAKETPLVATAAGFFDIGSVSGSCPTWTLPESEWLPAMTFDFFCNATALEIIGWAGWVILCVGAFRAFEIAMY